MAEDRSAARLADGLKGDAGPPLARVSYYNTLAASWRVLHPQERLGVDAAQTRNRISRRLADFRKEVGALRRKVAALSAMLAVLGRSTDGGQKGVPNPQRLGQCRKAIAILKDIRRRGQG